MVKFLPTFVAYVVIVDSKSVLFDTFKFALALIENEIEPDEDVDELIVEECVIDMDVLIAEDCVVDEDAVLVKGGLLDEDKVLEVRVVVRGGSFKRTKLQIK